MTFRHKLTVYDLNCSKRMIIGSNIICLETTGSTNNHARMLLKEIPGPVDGCVIRSGFQSAGRGQPGNSWESEKDSNLLFSVIIYPGMISPSAQFLISMSVSLAISDFLGHHGIGNTIKWPNDIFAGDRKIAGILIENSVRGDSIEHCIIGIGLNVNQLHFTSNAPNPVSMSMLTGIRYDTTTCFSELLSFLDRRYKDLIRGDSEEVREEYLRALYRTGEWHDYLSDGKVFRGRIRSVTSTGLLVVEDKYGRVREFAFKEIDYLLTWRSSL